MATCGGVPRHEKLTHYIGRAGRFASAAPSLEAEGWFVETRDLTVDLTQERQSGGPVTDAGAGASNRWSIEAEALRFEYPTSAGGFRLQLAEWRLRSGSQCALHGPSGCGKSTLLKLLAGVLVPTSGRLVVAGESLGDLSEAQRRAFRIRQVGFVFQDFPLLDSLSLLDNVLLAYRLNPVLRLDSKARSRARELLVELGLGERARESPARFSQGERQRVAIARALVVPPPLLLADEPTAGLDPEQSLAVYDLLSRWSERTSATTVWVTHDPALLERFDDRLDVARCTLSGDGQ